MDDHRRHRQCRRGHRISSFNPTCCFGASPPKEPSPKRTTCTTITSRPKQMRLLRFGSMPAALTSPRIGCLGQIKRRKPSSNSHRPSSAATTTSSSSSSTISSSSSLPKSDKLLKFTTALLWRRPSSRVEVSVSFVEDMDPPLPVVRRPSRGGNLASLWQRRRGGGSSGACETNSGLQIEVGQRQPRVFIGQPMENSIG